MNINGLSIGPFDAFPLTADMIADLQSDHAGEAGAVEVYRGMLSTARDETVRRFARAHIRTERRHLRFFSQWLPERHHSRLLRVWRAAGWLLGAGAALVGRRAAFHTVYAIETFVERHYLAQIRRMQTEPELASLCQVLRGFCDEEVQHRDDARRHGSRRNGLLARAWVVLVGHGSSLGVRIARKV